MLTATHIMVILSLDFCNGSLSASSLLTLLLPSTNLSSTNSLNCQSVQGHSSIHGLTTA